MKSLESFAGNPLCIVRCADGAPIETHGNEWETPCYTDETGAVTWLFESIGDLQIADVLGYAVASYTALPSEWEFPNESTWECPPIIAALKPLPVALKDEIAFLSSVG